MERIAAKYFARARASVTRRSSGVALICFFHFEVRLNFIVQFLIDLLAVKNSAYACHESP
jgi:hypothetical protein